MVKIDICLEGARKQNAIFSESVPPKNAPMRPMFRISPAGGEGVGAIFLGNNCPETIKTIGSSTNRY